MLNFNDYDDAMHSNEWSEFTLDAQTADPIEGNHYYQGRPKGLLIPLLGLFGVLAVCHSFCNYFIYDYNSNTIFFRKVFYEPQDSMEFAKFGCLEDPSKPISYGDKQYG